MLLVDALKLGILSSNAVFTPEPVVRVNDKVAAGLSCGALSHQRAALAGPTKTNSVFGADRPNDARQARHRVRFVVDGDVIDGAATGHGPAQRHRFNGRGVTGRRCRRTRRRFHVVTSDQRQQGNSFLLLLGQNMDVDAVQQYKRISDQPGDELIAGVAIIPRDVGLARLGIVVTG
nr:hypothetical protein [Cryobacterium sp. Y11]